MSEKEIALPEIEEIVEINNKITKNKGLLNKSSLSFIYDKLKYLKRRYKNRKKVLSLISSTLLYEITTQHPFVDGNKRTAIEVVKYFLELNNSFLNMSYNYLIYLSLKIANKDISFNKLNSIIEKHIGEKDDEKKKNQESNTSS